MGRLIAIEFFKLKNTKYFWVLIILFGIFLLSVPFSTKAFLDYLGSTGENMNVLGVSPGDLPLFDFVDLWQNLTWVYRSFSVFLGFVIVISVTNEYSYGTIKQNVIDGLSRKEFFYSKVGYIVAISLAVTLVVLLVGLVSGYLWSPVTEMTYVVRNMEFLPAYFLHLVAFQLFCMVIALLIKRSGITIALIIFYVYIIEPIVTAILRYEFELTFLADLFPSRAIDNIIANPLPKFIMQETQNYVGMDDLGILLVYTAILGFVGYRMMATRDLR